MNYPPEPEVGELLRKLLNCKVEVKPVRSGQRRPSGVQAVATYVDDEKNPIAWLAMEIPVAASAGGALMLLPPMRVKEDSKNGKLEGELHDGFYEVANIASRWFNDGGTSHVTLKDVEYLGDREGDWKATWRLARKDGRHYQIKVRDGEPGNLWMYAA